jgi:opacity protein-like surface antigen
MKRLILAAVAAAALTAPAMAADCAKDYKDFWQSLDREKFAKMSPEQIADLSRTALRGYDSCSAGDERFTAKNFYEKLQSQANAKASDIFKDGAFGPAGSPNVKK